MQLEIVTEHNTHGVEFLTAAKSVNKTILPLTPFSEGINRTTQKKK